MSTVEATERLSSTGRTPALAPAQVQTLLERYFAEDKPSIPSLAEEFSQTNSKGVTSPLSLATVRKYLKAAGITLPRGRASDLPRTPQSVRSLMNRIPTETLIGKGRAELLLRRVDRGEGVVSLAKEFGLSKDRVRRLRDRAMENTETGEMTEEETVEDSTDGDVASMSVGASVEAEVAEADEDSVEDAFDDVEVSDDSTAE